MKKIIKKQTKEKEKFTYEEFRIKFLPQTVKRERLAKLSPGKRIANEIYESCMAKF